MALVCKRSPVVPGVLTHLAGMTGADADTRLVLLDCQDDGASRLDRAAALERADQRHVVGVLEVAADRQPARDP